MSDNNSSIENMSIQNDDDDDKNDLFLSSKEWSLLTYIVRTYDVDTAIQIAKNRNLIKQKRKIINLKFFQEYNKRSKISLYLFNTKQSLLSNIIHTYDIHSAIPIVQHILSKKSSYQPKLCFKLSHTLNIINIFFSSLRLFINKIINHTMINKNCQKQIINYNFFSLACLSGLFIGRKTYLLHNRAHSTNFNII